jgi:hypothetical protein
VHYALVQGATCLLGNVLTLSGWACAGCCVDWPMPGTGGVFWAAAVLTRLVLDLGCFPSRNSRVNFIGVLLQTACWHACLPYMHEFTTLLIDKRAWCSSSNLQPCVKCRTEASLWLYKQGVGTTLALPKAARWLHCRVRLSVACNLELLAELPVSAMPSWSF